MRAQYGINDLLSFLTYLKFYVIKEGVGNIAASAYTGKA